VDSPSTSDTTELISGSRRKSSTKAKSGKKQSDKKQSKGGWCSCFSLACIAQYFDVNTSDVRGRILNVLSPCPRDKFLSVTQANPDFYGPFWIATTLIFVIGVTANINEYASSEDKTWHYDISKPSLAFSIVYAYVPLFGLCLWFVLKYLGVKIESEQTGDLQDPSLSAMVCLAGYVMITFIPFLIMCSVPGSSFVLSMLSLGALYACGILYRELSPLLREDGAPSSSISKKPLLTLILAVLVGAFSVTCWLAFY